MDNNVTDMIITGTAGTGKSRFFSAMNEDKDSLVVSDKDEEDIDKAKENIDTEDFS